MKLQCPKCHHEFKSENQAKGGRARWRGVSRADRTEANRKAAQARWAAVAAAKAAK